MTLGLSIVLVALGWMLTAGACLNFIAVVQATRWLGKHGIDYINEIKSIEAKPQELVRADLDGVFDRSGGAFWPFGVKDYRWKRSVRRLRTDQRMRMRFVGALSDIARNLFFRYRRITVLSSAIVLALAVFAAAPARPMAADIMVKALWLALVALNLAIMAEFIYGSVVLVDYFRYFHLVDLRFRYRNAESSGHPNLRAFDGIWRIVELLGHVALTGVSFIFFASVSERDFNIGQGISEGRWAAGPASLGKLFVQCVYFVVTTMSTTGYGDIHPIGTWGYILCSCLELEVFTLVVLAATTFWSARQGPNGRPA